MIGKSYWAMFQGPAYQEIRPRLNLKTFNLQKSHPGTGIIGIVSHAHLQRLQRRKGLTWGCARDRGTLDESSMGQAGVREAFGGPETYRQSPLFRLSGSVHEAEGVWAYWVKMKLGTPAELAGAE